MYPCFCLYPRWCIRGDAPMHAIPGFGYRVLDRELFSGALNRLHAQFFNQIPVGLMTLFLNYHFTSFQRMERERKRKLMERHKINFSLFSLHLEPSASSRLAPALTMRQAHAFGSLCCCCYTGKFIVLTTWKAPAACNALLKSKRDWDSYIGVAHCLSACVCVIGN